MNASSQETVDIVTLQEFSLLLQSQPRKSHPGSGQIHKVPPQVRQRRQKSQHVYDPVMVSLGPYHHGKPELRQAEEFKYVCLDWFALGDEEKKGLFYNKILEKIDAIRGCYAEVSIVEKYIDKALALMILLDACFIINFIDNCIRQNNFEDWLNFLGVAGSIPFAARDIMVLENQIPFQALKLLINLRCEKEDAEELLTKFTSWMMGVDQNKAKIPREYEDPPIHLLEAVRRVMVEKPTNKQVHNQLAPKIRCPKLLMSGKKTDKNVSYTCRSVMDLKAKGIHFRPSSSHSLRDITFKSHAFYGQLQLPVRYVSDQAHVILSNMIAFEISPTNNTEPVILSYANFMKSLIEGPADVKELQDRGILFNRFADHEQVVKVFQEIDTFGLVNFDVFVDVRHSVGEHCRNRSKTWIADLIHARFESPWTAIALLAAILLLCLTFLQTYFTIHPVK